MFNQWQGIGNLGRDPEVRATESGKQIANLSVACTKRWKDRNTGETKEDTYWARVAIMADGLVNVAANYLKKGSKVFIQGELRERRWTDQQGVERYTTEVIVGSFGGKLVMLDKHEGNGGPPPAGQDLDDEIPF